MDKQDEKCKDINSQKLSRLCEIELSGDKIEHLSEMYVLHEALESA